MLNVEGLSSRCRKLVAMTEGTAYPMRKRLSEFPLELPPIRVQGDSLTSIAAAAQQMCEDLGMDLVAQPSVHGSFVRITLHLPLKSCASSILLRERIMDIHRTLIRFERIRRVMPQYRCAMREMSMFKTPERRSEVEGLLAGLLTTGELPVLDDQALELAHMFEPSSARTLLAQAA
jgi:hypothetical protein